MPIKVLTIELDGDATSLQGIDEKRIVIKLPTAPIKSLPTTTMDKLKWEPTIEVAAYKNIPKKLRKQLLRIANEFPTYRELVAMIGNSQPDQVLMTACAYVEVDGERKVLGWSILNAWVAQTGHEAAMLLFIDKNSVNQKVELLVCEAVLLEVSKYDFVYVPTF